MYIHMYIHMYICMYVHMNMYVFNVMLCCYAMLCYVMLGYVMYVMYVIICNANLDTNPVPDDSHCNIRANFKSAIGQF